MLQKHTRIVEVRELNKLQRLSQSAHDDPVSGNARLAFRQDALAQHNRACNSGVPQQELPARYRLDLDTVYRRLRLFVNHRVLLPHFAPRSTRFCVCWALMLLYYA